MPWKISRKKTWHWCQCLCFHKNLNTAVKWTKTLTCLYLVSFGLKNKKQQDKKKENTVVLPHCFQSNTLNCHPDDLENICSFQYLFICLCQSWFYFAFCLISNPQQMNRHATVINLNWIPFKQSKHFSCFSLCYTCMIDDELSCIICASGHVFMSDEIVPQHHQISKWNHNNLKRVTTQK